MHITADSVVVHVAVIYAAFWSAALPVVSNSSSHAHAAKVTAISKFAHTLNPTRPRYNPVRKVFCEMLTRVLSDRPQAQGNLTDSDDPSPTLNDGVFVSQESPVSLCTTISKPSEVKERTESWEVV